MVCTSFDGLVAYCAVHDTPFFLSLCVCRFVQILAGETDESVCGPPSASSSSSSSTLKTSTVHTSPSSTFLATPTPSPSAAPSSTPSDPPPILPTSSPFTPSIDPLLVQPVQSGSGLTLFIVGILFLILGISLIVIAAVVLVQHRKACSLNVRGSAEEGKVHRSPYPKLAPTTLNDDVTRVSQSSSLDSTAVQDAIQNGIVTVPIPQSEGMESERSEGEEVAHSNNLTQANGHCLQSMQPTDTDTAILGSITPPEERNFPFIPGVIITLDEELTQSSCA